MGRYERRTHLHGAVCGRTFGGCRADGAVYLHVDDQIDLRQVALRLSYAHDLPRPDEGRRPFGGFGGESDPPGQDLLFPRARRRCERRGQVVGVDFGDARDAHCTCGRDLLRRVRPGLRGRRRLAQSGCVRPHEERQYADEYLETAMGYGRESCRDDLRQLLHGGQFQRRSLQVDRLYPHLGSGHRQGRHTAPVRATRSAATAATWARSASSRWAQRS